ncbi:MULTISPECIES: hypothetical protein [Streptomyces]|uniref:hypothetical protein n=1 Tax=Streptomyces TaxID=1883 RepID=UPI0031ECA37E
MDPADAVPAELGPGERVGGVAEPEDGLSAIPDVRRIDPLARNEEDSRVTDDL